MSKLSSTLIAVVAAAAPQAGVHRSRDRGASASAASPAASRRSRRRSTLPKTATRSRSATARSRAGVTIDASVQLARAGAHATIIEGGGPVITIGQALAPDPPTVSIRGVTITGGEVTRRATTRSPHSAAASSSRSPRTSVEAQPSRSPTASSPATVPRRRRPFQAGPSRSPRGPGSTIRRPHARQHAGHEQRGRLGTRAALARDERDRGRDLQPHSGRAHARALGRERKSRTRGLAARRCGELRWDLHPRRADGQEQRHQREQCRARVVGSADGGAGVPRGRDPRAALPGRVLRATQPDHDHQHDRAGQSSNHAERQRRRARACLRRRDRRRGAVPTRAQHRQRQRRSRRLGSRRGGRRRRARGDRRGHDPRHPDRPQQRRRRGGSGGARVRRGDRELRTADPGANARARQQRPRARARAAGCRSASPPPRSAVASGMAASAARRLRS